jgi:hypothetical protein
MTRNHLPGGLDLETFGRPLFAESPFRGVGFGLGFAVVIDPLPGKVICSAGEISWGGAASTTFGRTVRPACPRVTRAPRRPDARRPRSTATLPALTGIPGDEHFIIAS